MTHQIIIRNNKTTPLYAGHPWVFSGALIKKYDKIKAGSVVELVDESNQFIAYGIYNANQSICFRALSFNKKEFNCDNINEKFDAKVDFLYKRFYALKMQKTAMLDNATNGYRLVNSDGDYLAGLIIDVYDTLAVFQIAIVGMELFQEAIIEALIKLGFETIIEKSDSETRKLEGLAIKEIILHKGERKDAYSFVENNMLMFSNPLSGQKTGFFLDQRIARKWLLNNSLNKKVVNLYSYYGAFSLSALMGGAKSVLSVDISAPAIGMCEKIINMNVDNNNLSKESLNHHVGLVQDVFEFLKQDLECDILVCDPPSFAKHKNAIDSATNAYVKLNRLCLSKLKSGDVLITSSCTGLIKMEDFVNILKKSSFLEKKPLKILASYGADFDHSAILGFKEGEYLKTLILQVI